MLKTVGNGYLQRTGHSEVKNVHVYSPACQGDGSESPVHMMITLILYEFTLLTLVLVTISHLSTVQLHFILNSPAASEELTGATINVSEGEYI